MKRMVLVFALILVSTCAMAGQIEFGEMSCGSYINKIGALAESNMQAASTLLVWMYGYGIGAAGKTTFDQDGFGHFSRALAEHCLDNIETPVLDAARTVGSQE